jgi:hypothetical protein
MNTERESYEARKSIGLHADTLRWAKILAHKEGLAVGTWLMAKLRIAVRELAKEARLIRSEDEVNDVIQDAQDDE